MISSFNIRAQPASGFCSELTAVHPVLRYEAGRCLNAVASLGEGEYAEATGAIIRSHRFLGLTSGYFAGRRTVLWPVLEDLVPSAHSDFARLAEHSEALEFDVAAMYGAVDDLRAALHSNRDAAGIGRIALRSMQPAKILHDALALNLGDEELVLRGLFGGLSRRQLARTRQALGFRLRFHEDREREQISRMQLLDQELALEPEITADLSLAESH